MNVKKFFYFTVAFVLVSLVIFSHFTTNLSTHSSKQFVKQQSLTPLLLFWGSPKDDKYRLPSEGSRLNQCRVTHKRRKLSEADAVIFPYTTISSSDIPWRHYRHKKQVFIWWSMESPAHLQLNGRDLREFDGGFFNWTWTYRRDADVFDGFGYRGNLLAKVPRGKEAVDKILKSKTKVAIWIVNDCFSTYGQKMRWKFAMALREAGLNFSGYGECFNNSDDVPPNTEYTRQLIQQHKFYFAFEDAIHCTDYITHEFWSKALRSGAVPVVWGPKKEDVLSVAPPDSFIFAEDFKTPKELAKYLLELNEDDENYAEYLRWRAESWITDEDMIYVMQYRYFGLPVQTKPKTICEKLMENNSSKIIPSLAHVFIGSNSEVCLTESFGENSSGCLFSSCVVVKGEIILFAVLSIACLLFSKVYIWRLKKT